MSATTNQSPPHGGVDRNSRDLGEVPVRGGRLLTGAWIETASPCGSASTRTSPPHGGVDRNILGDSGFSNDDMSPPHGGVDRNPRPQLHQSLRRGRLLTGAWIETGRDSCRSGHANVASSRGRGSKHVAPTFASASRLSPPHGGVDRNKQWAMTIGEIPEVASSRGRGSKHGEIKQQAEHNKSPPHGGVDRNPRCRPSPGNRSSRLLTGAWIETARWRRPCPAAGVASSRGRGSKPL